MIPFRREHLLRMSHPDAGVLAASDGAARLEEYPSFSFTDGDVMIGCGGMHPIWPGRWNGWAFLEPSSGPHMLAILRVVKTVLSAYPVPRLEVQVVVGFNPGIRFAQLIGFQLETPEPSRRWTPDDQDVFQFSIVKDR